MMTTEKTATAGIPSPCLKNEEKTSRRRGEKTVTQHDPSSDERASEEAWVINYPSKHAYHGT